MVSFPVRSAGPLRPPRLTFARMCIWCGGRDCDAPDCVQLHEVSEWVVCRHCHGTGEGFKAGPHGCTCAFGLVLVAPLIQRRRALIPGPNPLYTVDEGHWSAYFHRKYASEPIDQGSFVAVPTPVAAEQVAL